MASDTQSEPTEKRVLVVDNSRVQRALAREELEELGYSVVEAADACEARKQMESGAPDAVMMGWEISGTSGLDLIAQWQEHPDHRWVPVLMVTSHIDPDRIQRAMDAGAADYVKKPYEPIELTARLRSALRIKALQDQLRHLASFDALTGLLNRRVVMERLHRDFERSHRYGEELSVAIADIDHFKLVNDTYGHDIGDVILKQVANEIAENVRATDTAARLGGEEFVVLMPSTGDDGAQIFLERIRRRIALGVWGTDDLRIEVTVSIGLASYQTLKASDADALLKAADQALYRAKESGRNRVESATRNE